MVSSWLLAGGEELTQREQRERRGRGGSRRRVGRKPSKVQSVKFKVRAGNCDGSIDRGWGRSSYGPSAARRMRRAAPVGMTVFFGRQDAGAEILRFAQDDWLFLFWLKHVVRRRNGDANREIHPAKGAGWKRVGVPREGKMDA